MDKLSKEAFRHVEKELYDYHRTKREIDRLRDEILYASGERDDNADIRSGRIGDPTGQRATVLAMNPSLEHMEAVVSAIDAVLHILEEPQKQLVLMYYWTRNAKYTWVGIGGKIGVHEKTARRWRDDIVAAIAEKMGWR